MHKVKQFIALIAICSLLVPTSAMADNKCEHEWGAWTEQTAKKWTRIDEETGIEEFGGTYTEIHECSICHDSEVRTVGYPYQCIIERQSPTCSESGYVIVDHNGEAKERIETKPAEGHAWSSWKITKQPSATEFGEITRTCSRCHKVETGEIEKLEINNPVKSNIEKSPVTEKPITVKENNTKQVKTQTSQQQVKVPTVSKKPSLKATIKGKKSVSLKKGKTVKIKVTRSENKGKIKFKSSNKKVVTVSAKGKVKAKKRGKATITVSWNGIKKKIKIKVK